MKMPLNARHRQDLGVKYRQPLIESSNWAKKLSYIQDRWKNGSYDLLLSIQREDWLLSE